MKLATEEQVEQLHTIASEWLTNSPTGVLFSDTKRIAKAAVMEFIANQHELTMYERYADPSEGEQPYIVRLHTRRFGKIMYNPNYGDDRICECGDPYDRHFDSYEDIYPIGCKYCDCVEFKEKKE